MKKSFAVFIAALCLTSTFLTACDGGNLGGEVSSLLGSYSSVEQGESTESNESTSEGESSSDGQNGSDEGSSSGGQNGSDEGSSSGSQNGSDEGSSSDGQNGSDEGSSSGGQNGSDEGGNSGDEGGAGDEGGLKEDTDFGALVSDVVTETEWRTAFSAAGRENVSCVAVGDGGREFTVKRAGNKMYMRLSVGATAMTSYAEATENGVYGYSYDGVTQSWSKSIVATAEYANSFMETYLSITRPDLSECYTYFAYSESQGGYVLKEEATLPTFWDITAEESVLAKSYQAGEVLVKIVDGRVAVIRDDGAGSGMAGRYYDYGATEVTLPQAEEYEDTPNQPNEEARREKTQLEIGVYDGSYGYAWLEKICRWFEEVYKDASFEEGKQGIQVNIVPKKMEYTSSMLIPNLQAGVETADVIFAEEDYSELVDAGVALDITDALSERVYDAQGEFVVNGEYSIRDRWEPYFDAYYWREGDYSDKLYGIPWTDSLTGMVYDVDLFEEKGYEVPATMAEFTTLLDRMVGDNVIPFAFSGDADFYYSEWLAKAVYAQYEGVESFHQDLFYDGVYNGEPITVANAYKLADKQGYLKTYEFMRQISQSRYCYPDSFKAIFSCYRVQDTFLTSVLPGQERIAMIVEGDWWENEARDTFNQMSYRNPDYGYGQRRFAMMPIPAMEGQASEKHVLYANDSGTAFIPKSADNVEAGKEFLQFFASRSSLAQFTKDSGSVLPYDYELTESEYAQLTYFGQSVYNLRRDENVEIVRDGVTCDFRREMGTAFNSVVGLKDFYVDQSLTATEVYATHVQKYGDAAAWAQIFNEYYGN